MMVLLLFFCSGATALIYEVIWSKYLTMLFGSTVQAQTVVLAVFMGGLALGNKIFGGRADRSREPLELYGRLEIVIGLYAIAFRWLYLAGDSMFIKLGHGRLDSGGWLFLIKAFLSVGLLLGPTILMGGTLPLLAAWLQRRTSDASRASARFYAVNSLGAVFGSWLAGFYLVQHLGLVSGVEMTACANVLIGIAAIVLSRREGESDAPAPAKESAAASAATKTSILSSGLLLVAVTGAVSMGLEVLSSRTLALIVGGSLQSFAIVLMAFILGIGIGGSIIASAGWKRISEATVTITLLLCAAAIVGSLVLGIEYWVAFYGAAKNGLASTAMGYRYHQVLTAAMAIVVLGLPAGMLGAVLPLWIRHLSGANQGLAGQVGRLLTWNTVGAVIGTLLTGFFLMPHLGLRGSYLALVLVLCGVAAWTAWAKESRAVAGVAGAIGLAFAALGLTTGEGWRDVLSSGMFRVRNYGMNFKEFKELRRSFKLVFYEDAPDATVSVEVGDGVRAKHQTTLRINGKADATTHGDLSTQYLLAHLPMLAKPDAKEIFVLGFGSGATAGALTGHPIKSLTIAENCEPVLRASVHFAELNRNVLSNALTHVRNEDARTVLKLNPTKFDVIISEPSNPWMAGVGSVFSKEFYQLAASKLNQGGVMAQWFHIYEMSDGIVSLVIRTFNQVFPNMEIWDSQMGDIILLGSKTPWPSNPDVYRKVFERAEPRKDLERIGLKSPELVWARQLASQRTAYALATAGPIQSDVFPVLEYQAPEAFFIGENAALLMLFDERSWQSELMPADKARGLAQLDDDSVKSVFGEYYSANADLGRYMVWRFQSDPAGAAASPMNDSRAFPCVFRPATNTLPHKLDIPKEADDELRQFLLAEHDLFTNTNQWQAAADRIIELTKTVNLTKPDGKPRAWHTTFFVNNAARKALAHGDHARASKLLIAGLEKQPRSYQLLYLARILEREAEAQGKAKVAGK